MTLRRTLRRLASTLRPARPRPVEVTVTDPAEIPPLLYWATFDRGLRIHLPTRLLSSAGAYAYGGGWHPFIAALAEGPDALAWYYDHHRRHRVVLLPPRAPAHARGPALGDPLDPARSAAPTRP